MMKHDTIEVLAGLILSVIVAGSGAIAYAFTTFETKSTVKDLKEDIVRRLERIENKIDQRQ